MTKRWMLYSFVLSLTTLCLWVELSALAEAAGMGHRMRHRMQHQLHHGLGFEGEGVCPQERFTASAPAEVQKLTNPLKPTPNHLEAGRSLFHTDAQPTACKVCHGPGSNGMGMMSPGLNPPPRNFSCAETMKNISDGQMFWIIKNGSQGTGMPPYKLNLDDHQIWQLIMHIRELGKQAR